MFNVADAFYRSCDVYYLFVNSIVFVCMTLPWF